MIMKKLFLSLLLFVAVKSHAYVTCLTNVSIYVCAPSGYVMIGGSTNYNSNSGYTEAHGMDLTSNACNDDGGCLLAFYVDGCSGSPTVVAYIVIECDTSMYCGGGLCPNGANNGIEITIPAHYNGITGKLYQKFGCCEIDWCPRYPHPCEYEQ
jgi:hypothetical protein